MGEDAAPKAPRAETYLGDGVYASYDGFQVWLRTDRGGGQHLIALETGTYMALINYVKSLQSLKD